MKSVIDIEELLIWAYRHERVEEMARHGLSEAPTVLGYADMYGVLEDVARLGCWARPTAEMIEGESADALTVHDAVLKLPGVYVEWRGPDEVVMPAWTVDALAAAGRRPMRIGGDWVIEDADGLKSPASLIEPTILVMIHARSGARPEAWDDWMPGDEGLTGGAVALDRVKYLVWRSALSSLAGALADRLDDWRPVEPAAPESPWSRRVLQTVAKSASGNDRIKTLKRQRKNSS